MCAAVVDEERSALEQAKTKKKKKKALIIMKSGKALWSPLWDPFEYLWMDKEGKIKNSLGEEVTWFDNYFGGVPYSFKAIDIPLKKRRVKVEHKRGD